MIAKLVLSTTLKKACEMQLKEMHPNLRPLMLKLAEMKVREQELYDRDHANAEPNPASIFNVIDASDWITDEYREHCRATEQFEQQVALLAEKYNFPIQSKMIAGCAPNHISHYDIDDAVAEHFPNDEVTVDSEHSAIFIYCTPRYAQKVYDFVAQYANGGEVVYNSGDVDPSGVHIDDAASITWPHANNWTSWQKWLEQARKEKV